MDLENAINHARLAKAIDSENRDSPANTALVVLLAEIERLESLERCPDCNGEMSQCGELDEDGEVALDCKQCRQQAEIERLTTELSQYKDRDENWLLCHSCDSWWKPDSKKHLPDDECETPCPNCLEIDRLKDKIDDALKQEADDE